MAWYIITKRKEYFLKIGEYNYCGLEDMVLDNKIGVDSETTSLSPREGEMFAIQLASYKDSYLIDLESISLSDVIPYLEGKILVMHNATFDLGWLYVKANFFPKKVRDTFIASRLMHIGLDNVRHGFGPVMERELDNVVNKEEQKNIAKVKLSNSRAIEYCFNDVDRLLELHDVLEQKIKDGGYFETYKLHVRYIRALAYMEQCGLPVSYEKWKAKCISDKLELKDKERIVIEYIYEHLPQFRDVQIDMFSSIKKIKVQLSSSKQMIPVFKAFGIDVTNPEDAEKESIQENVIKKTKHPFVDLWLDYQGFAHDVSTFGENLLAKIQDDRMFTTFNPILNTARISTRKKEINFLNFPANEKTRECITITKHGWKFIVCDYAAQEARMGADITEDQAMIDSIVLNKCLHCAFARVLYPEIADLSDEEIMKNHKDKRQAAKAPRFLFKLN